MKQGTTVDDLEDKAGSDVWVYDASKNECDWTLHRYKNYKSGDDIASMHNWTDTLVDIAGLRAYVISEGYKGVVLTGSSAYFK